MVLTLELAMLQEKYGKYKVENKKAKRVLVVVISK